MMRSILFFIAVAAFSGPFARAAGERVEPLAAPEYSEDMQRAAERFNASAKGALAQVYPAMAEWLAARYGLEKARGIGIDLGGGPGDLIIELCKRTESMFWINADINTFNFRHMYAAAARAGLEHRAGAVFADAHALPFKDKCADFVVSRGTFQFWQDKPRAFREVLRVLKPGGAAFIGRGFTENLGVEAASAIRKAQGDGGPAYDVAETAEEFRRLMDELGVSEYQIIIPPPRDADGEAASVKYGIWLEFWKKR